MPTIQTVGAAQVGENVLAVYPVPYKGVIQGVNELQLPKDALWLGENVHFFEGELRQRPSWNLRRNTILATIPAAIGITVGLFTGHRATTTNQFLFAGGTQAVYVLSDATNTWLSIQTWADLRSQDKQVRFTELAIGTPLVTRIIFCNGVDVPALFVLTAASGGFVGATSLVVPNNVRFKDVCTSSDRIIGITDTEVYWSQALSVTFPETAVKSLAESLDLNIAIRPIGTLNVGIWKERSLWIGLARGGSDAGFFSWRLLKWVEGPAAPNALVVDTTGNWYWMTRTGRVIKMDSSFAVTYPADGIWPLVRKEINVIQASGYGRSHAVYRPIHDEVWFFYKRVSTAAPPLNTGFVDTAIVLCNASTPQPAAVLARFSDGAGFDVVTSARVSENMVGAVFNAYDDEAVVVHNDATTVPVQNTVFLAQELQSTGGGGGTGNDFFTVLVQTGLQPAQGRIAQDRQGISTGDTHRLESIEVFQRRGVGVHPGTATITVAPISSNILDVQAGTIGAAVTIPGLDAASPVKAVTGLSATGRFFGFKLTGSNQQSAFRYLGALLRGRRVT